MSRLQVNQEWPARRWYTVLRDRWHYPDAVRLEAPLMAGSYSSVSPVTRSVTRLTILGAVVLATLWLTLASFSTPFGWDSPAWALETRWWSEFDIAPYRDTVETKQPGLFIFLRVLLEHTAWALWPLRLSMMVLYAIGAAAFTIVAARYAPIGMAGVAAVTWVWLSTHPVFVYQGWETDELVAIANIVAAALMHVSPFGAGVAIALAASIKPTVLGIALFVWLGTRGHRWRVVAGGAVTLIAIYGYTAWAIGWYPQAMLIFLKHGHADVGWWPRWELFRDRFNEYFAPFLPFCIWAGGGASIELLRGGVAIQLWAVVEALQVMAQLRAGNHHFVPFLVPMMLLCVVTFAASWRCGRLFTVACFAIGTAAYVPMLGAHMLASAVQWQQLTAGNWPVHLGEPIQVEVGAYLREHTTDADRIHVHGNDHPDTFIVYWESRRRPAAYLYYNSEVSPRVFDMEQQAIELARARPTYIVVMLHNPVDPLRPLLEREYVLEKQFWGSGRMIDCWRLRERRRPS